MNRYNTRMEQNRKAMLAYILPFIIIYGLMFFLFRGLSKGGGIMGVGKSNAKIYNVEKVVRSDDAEIILGGYNPKVVYDERKDDVEVSLDKTQLVKEISVQTDDAPTL